MRKRLLAWLLMIMLVLDNISVTYASNLENDENVQEEQTGESIESDTLISDIQESDSQESDSEIGAEEKEPEAEIEDTIQKEKNTVEKTQQEQATVEEESSADTEDDKSKETFDQKNDLVPNAVNGKEPSTEDMGEESTAEEHDPPEEKISENSLLTETDPEESAEKNVSEETEEIIEAMPENRQENAIDLPLDQNLEVTLEENGEIWYSFTPEDDSFYQIISSGDIDSKIEVYSSGEWIGEDDDSGKDYNFSYVFQGTPGKSYEFRVFTYGGDAGSFSILLTKLDIQTSDLLLDTEQTVHVEESIGEIWYKYTPEETGAYVFSSSGEADPYAEVHLEDQTLCADNDSGENNNFRCEFIAVAGNTYYFRLQNAVPETDFNILLTKKAGLEAGVEKKVSFSEKTGEQFYSFTVPEEGRYTITSCGGIDPYLNVYIGHELIASSDNDGEDYGFKYSFEASAGDVYCFSFTDYGSDGSQGEFSVLVSKDEIGSLNLDENISVSLEGSYDEVWYCYTVEDPGMYTFGLSEGSSVYAEIYSENEFVDTNNSWDESGQRYRFFGERGKTYYFVIRNSGESSIECSAWLTGNQAQNLEPDQEVSVSSQTPGQEFWYTFTPSETGYFSLLTTGNCDTVATIYCNGEYKGSVDDSWGTTGDFSYRFWAEAGNIYSFCVSLYGSGTGDFSVLLKKTKISEIQMDKDILIDINAAEPEAWYLYTAAESENLQILLSGESNPYVVLYDEEDQEITSGSALQFTAEAGKNYYFRIYNQERRYGNVTALLSKAKLITDFKLAPGYYVPEKILYGESLDNILAELKFEVYYGDEVYTIGYWDSTLYGQSISARETNGGYDDNGIYSLGVHYPELVIGDKSIPLTIEVVTGDNYSFPELKAGADYVESEKNYNGKTGFTFTPEIAGRYHLSFTSEVDSYTIYRSDGNSIEYSNGIIEIPETGASYYILVPSQAERVQAKIENIPEVTDIKIADGYKIPDKILYGQWLGNILDDIRFDIYYGEEVQNISAMETTTYGDQISYSDSDAVYDGHGNYELGPQNFSIEVGGCVFELAIEVVTGQELGFPAINEDSEFTQGEKNYGSKVGFQFTPKNEGRYQVTFLSPINGGQIYDTSGNQIDSIYGDYILSSLKTGETYYFIIASDSDIVKIGMNYIPNVTDFDFAEGFEMPKMILFGESGSAALGNAKFDVSYGAEPEQVAFGSYTSYGDYISTDENYWDAYDENGVYKLGPHQFNIVAGNMKIPVSLEVVTGDQLGFTELRESAGYIESEKNYGNRVGYVFKPASAGKYQLLSENAENMELYMDNGKTVSTIYGNSLTEYLEAGTTYYLVVTTESEKAKVQVDRQPEAIELKVSSDFEIPQKILYGVNLDEALRDVKFDIKFDNGDVVSAYLHDWTPFGSLIEVEDISEEVYDEKGSYKLGEHTIRFVIDKAEIQTTVEVATAEDLGFKNLQAGTEYIELVPNYGKKIGFIFSPEESRDYRITYELQNEETYVTTVRYASNGNTMESYWGTDFACSMEKGVEYYFILSADNEPIRVKIEKVPEITDFNIYDASSALDTILYGESYWRALEQLKFQIEYDGKAEIFGYYDTTSEGQKISVQESGNTHDQNGNYRRGEHNLKIVIGDKEISYSLKVVNGSELGFPELFEGDDYKEAKCNYGKYVGYEFTALESKEYKISSSSMSGIDMYDAQGRSLVNSWSTEGLGSGYTYCDLEQGETYYIIIDPGTEDHTGVRVSDAFEYIPAPSNLQISNRTYSSISLQWSPLEGAGGYEIWRAESENGEYAMIETVLGGISYYTDKDVADHKTYYYRVRAYGFSGLNKVYSSFSWTVSAETLTLSAPTNIKAEPKSYNSVQVTWDEVNDADSYQVYRSVSKDGNYVLLRTYNKNTTSMTSQQLACGTTYYYKVRAYVEESGEKYYSDYSEIASATPVLSAPHGVDAEGSSYNTVKISWNKVEGAQFYQVYRSTSTNGKYALLGTYDENTSSSVSRELACGTTYYYKVRAYRWSGGERVFSNFSSIVNATPRLSAPQGVTAKGSSYNTVKISWNKVKGAQFYQVYRSTSINGKYALLGTYDENTSSSVSRELACGTTYYYKVRAYRWSGGERVFSNFSSIVNATPRLSAPQGVDAKGSSYNTVKIGWNKVEGAQFYQVYRSTSTNGKYALLGTYDENTSSSVSRALACGTTYYYKVRAYRWSGGERVFSNFSSIVNATPRLSTPSNVKANPQTSSTIKISWNKAEGISYYQVYRATSRNGKYALLGTYDSNTSSSISRSLKKNTTYYYKVRGYRWVNGERVFSSFSTVTSARTLN